MIYFTADTNATPVSVYGVGVVFEVSVGFSSPLRCETSTQPLMQWKPGALPLGVKRPVLETELSPPSSVDVIEVVELYPHSPDTPSWRGTQLKHRDTFTFTIFIPCFMCV